METDQMEHVPGLDQTLAQYRAAQKEFVRGNSKPFKALCSHQDDVTIAGGWGGIEKGWVAQVEGRYDLASARFASDDDERQIEHVSSVVGPTLAYSVDIERSTVRLSGSVSTRSLALRVTTIFRMEMGEWKIVHRHADPLVEVQGRESPTR